MKKLKKWDERAPELAHLLNPAFGGLLLRDFAAAFAKQAERAPEFELAFLVLPVVLHAPTRNLLPARSDQKLHVWLERNQAVRWDFEKRFTATQPYAREGLFFACQVDWLTISAAGTIVLGKKARPKLPKSKFSEETRGCLEDAMKLGRWLASQGDVTTTFGLWGVAP